MNKKPEDLLKEKIPLGVLSNTHGLLGDMKFYTFSNLYDITQNLIGKDIIAYHQSQKKFVVVKFERMRRAKGYLIVHIIGIDTISEAEKLKGFVVYVDKSFFPNSKDGEYYFFEILNSEVYDESNNFLGTVEDIIETGSNDVLVVRKEKEELLIPIIERYVKKIDKDGKKIFVVLPEWLE
ncbi:MAG: ribosome maturation factor RimM [Fervidobacterium sp.]